jgi:AcrR family transcriptional regulator
MPAATQSPRRRAAPETRRSELVDAALSAFTARGLAATAVDDIVRAAGVAKGTFYLYFSSKDDVVNAVAERIVDRVGDRVEAIASTAHLSPVDRLLALGRSLNEVGKDPFERELVEVFHRPENRAVHDRISEGVITRLAPALAIVIADGVAANVFRPQDPRLAAAFVLGSLTVLHHVVGDPDQMPVAIAHLDHFILRGLGFAGEIHP